MNARYMVKVMVKVRGAYASAVIGWVLAVLVLAISSVRAETVPDLYAVSIPVSEQSVPELQRAAAAGLRELAVRISGRSDAAGNPALSGLFANATRYLDQYRYERNTGTQWFAQLRFGAGPIDSALRSAGLPVWGNNRPALQVWLAVDDGKSRNFVDENSPVAAALREQLRRRGLLAHFPHDFSGVAIDDAWQLDIAKIQDAAKMQNSAAHERADTLLIGRINQMPGGSWQGSWVLNVNGQQFNAEGEGDSLTAYLAPTIDRIVDGFSPQYAVAASGAAEGIVLRITGVTSFDDYAAIVNYLRRLSLIKSASPVWLRNDELLLQLKIEGGTEQLTRQLALENRLAPADSSATAQTPLPVALSYRWSAPRG